MFANLKAQATAVANAAAEQATKAAAQVKERVDTGVAANKLLTEGGEGMKKKLLAKKASKDCTQIDAVFVDKFRKVMSDYKEAADKLKMAGDLASEDQDSFKKFGDLYGKRSAEIEAELGKLQAAPSEVATISPVEFDAIQILSAKMGVAGLSDKARSSVVGLSGSSAAADGGADNETGEKEKKGFMDMINEKGKELSDRANERVANAQAGKKMVDEGGDDMVTRLLAKKASYDSTKADTSAIAQLTKAVAAYGDAESKLKEALSEVEGDESSLFSLLAEKYSARGTELQALVARLAPVPEAILAHESERDGIVYLCAQMNVQTAKAQASTAATTATAVASAAATQAKGAMQGAQSAGAEGSGGYPAKKDSME